MIVRVCGKRTLVSRKATELTAKWADDETGELVFVAHFRRWSARSRPVKKNGVRQLDASGSPLWEEVTPGGDWLGVWEYAPDAPDVGIGIGWRKVAGTSGTILPNVREEAGDMVKEFARLVELNEGVRCSNVRMVSRSLRWRESNGK